MTPSASRGHHTGEAHSGSNVSRRDLYLMEKIHPEDATTAGNSFPGAAARTGRGDGRGSAGKAGSPSPLPPPPEAGGPEQRRHRSQGGNDESLSPPLPQGGVAAVVPGKVGQGRQGWCSWRTFCAVAFKGLFSRSQWSLDWQVVLVDVGRSVRLIISAFVFLPRPCWFWLA